MIDVLRQITISRCLCRLRVLCTYFTLKHWNVTFLCFIARRDDVLVDASLLLVLVFAVTLEVPLGRAPAVAELALEKCDVLLNLVERLFLAFTFLAALHLRHGLLEMLSLCLRKIGDVLVALKKEPDLLLGEVLGLLEQLVLVGD